MFLASFSRLFARSVSAWCASLILSALTLVAQTPTAADGFDPDVDGNVFAMATQADGKLLIGGQFTTVRGFPRQNLARLNADGSLDESFDPNANGPVHALVIQPDGRIVMGGEFTTLQPRGTGPVLERGRIARLNADGTVEAGFGPRIGGDLKPQVFALALQPDGSIVVGGNFTSVQPANATVIFTRNNLLRLTAAGGVDSAYDPNPNSTVLALVPHVDNKILVGGGFTSFRSANGQTTTRNRIARLNPNGTVDSEFNPNANNGVTSLAVQRDGKILLGGFFTTLQPVGDENPANRVRLARLNVNGTLDSEFYPRVEGNVATVAVQTDGAILVGGTFNAVWGRGTSATNRSYLARFNPDGSVDNAFAPVVNAEVRAFAPQADGKIVIGGLFTRAQPSGSSTPIVRQRLARLNADGSFDTSFELGAGGRILASVTQADGRIVIAGTFTNVGGAVHNYVARLNADGTVDNSYAPDFNGRVYTLALQPDGKVIVGGAFTTIGGERRERLARLNPNGTIDSEFYPHVDGQVGAVVLQSDGRIVVGGTFTSVVPVGGNSPTPRSNLLRLNANGTLDTTFDPSPNSSITALAVQSDGKILVGGLFSAFTPGLGSNTSATSSGRNFFARLNADGTIDANFAPNPNSQVSTIAVQSDGKVIIGGAFTGMAPPNATELTVRNRIARVNTDGTIDTAYNPNANDNVLASALQADGKLLIGGSFTTLQTGTATTFTLRKYAARLNVDGTVDAAYNLDLSELPGNRVDSLRVQADGRVLIGGSFTSIHPAGTAARVTRRNFARLAANGAVDPAFDASAGGATGAVVNGLAVQADGKVIAVGNFADLGGAKSTNIARFLPEGTADAGFSGTLAADGAVNTVIIRANGAPTATQVAGFAWLNPNGTPRPAFSPTARLSGEVNAIAVQPDGNVILGGAFADLGNTTGGNLIRFRPNGTVDTTFNPAPNGAVSALALQSDGKVIVAGSFTLVGGIPRNRLARLNANGTLDTAFDPNVNAKINAIVVQSDGLIVIGGTFTTLNPNGAETAVTRSYIARLNTDGTVDASYNPTPNLNVNSLVLQADGKIVAGGLFTAVQPNGGVDAFSRNGIARFNPDGTLDQNFDPSLNGAVNAIVPLANGQFVIGGEFTTLQPAVSGGVAVTRNYIARINSDGRVDPAFDPNANGPVTTLALQSDGALLIGGAFTSLKPAGTTNEVARRNFARVNADGTLDLNFNPDLNGRVLAASARPDGSVLVGGSFTALQLNGSILVGGSFASVGGVPARNLASLNDGGSVNTSFQPRPDGAVNALLALPDGRTVVGGEFSNIAGAARTRIARFSADGVLDATFNPTLAGTVSALALQGDGKVLVGLAGGSGAPPRLVVRLNADGSADGSFTGPASTAGAAERMVGLGVLRDGRVLALMRVQITGSVSHRLTRHNADGSLDAGFTPVQLIGASGRASFAVQADGRIIVSGQFAAVNGTSVANLARLNADGTVDGSFNPAPNGAVTAIALQADGRVVVGGSFSRIGGEARGGIARLAATSPATQVLGVAANRSTVFWNRTGTTGELAAVVFERSPDRTTWTALGNGVRVTNSADWQLSGLSLPATGVFYVRARGLAPSSGGTSSGILETVREFTFSSPLTGAATTVAQTPAQAAAPILMLDPVTGIAPRSRITMVAGEGAVEIIATPAADPAGGIAPRLTNLSTRGRVTAEDPLILGFAIAGTESRRVLIRAVGPALTGFGVTDALPATRLQIYNTSGAMVARNEGWAGAATLVQAAAATGAFPLAAGSADSATLVTLAPGNYTAEVVDPRGAGGVALAEIYDADSGTGARLVNVSSRGAAGTGNAALISGFVIAGGDRAERLLLRGVGPGLAAFGATGAVADPSIALFDAEGRALGANDNWVSSIADITAAAARSGAFALQPGSKDAAVLATLPSGAYTLQVSAGGTGTALLEIYEVR
jgi:uncharacterized delta-60 repeat protein